MVYFYPTTYYMNTVFIHTNNKQMLGAFISKFSIKRALKNPDSVRVEFINVDEIQAFKNFSGKEYINNGQKTIYNPKDLQSFTISRFMPPELMNYEGRAVVIDPDIFAREDISELFTMDMHGKTIAACHKKEGWDTSMMVLDCAKLRHWDVKKFLNQLTAKELDYRDLLRLKKENPDMIMEMPRIWNNLDTLTPETKMIHMTDRLTQPWKTGLPIDFIRNKMPKIAGIIPREWVYRLLGKYQTRYQPHPNKEIEKMFFTLVRDALQAGAVTKDQIQHEIDHKHVRGDLFHKLKEV
jgi:hypothetical protein